MDANAILDELKRQVQELRAAGAEPAVVALGDVAYETLCVRAGFGFGTVNLLEPNEPATAWFGPGAPPEGQSAIAPWLSVRRVGPGEQALVLVREPGASSRGFVDRADDEDLDEDLDL
jgi:hypothetical protein